MVQMIRLLLLVTTGTLITVISGGEVRLTQETPCVTGQGCRLKCSLVAGNLNLGFAYTAGSTAIASCTSFGTCSTLFPGEYNATLEDSRTSSYLDILSFQQTDVHTWRCNDGSSSPSNLPVVQNVLPSGVLTFGSTCQSGRVTSPASLSCSGLSPGVPPASLQLKDSNSQTVNSSQTGSVMGTVTRGGQASCSVSWSAFPSYTLNISPVQCDVQVAATAKVNVTSSNKGQVQVITCTAEGRPAEFNFRSWRQTWGGQEVRNVTGSQQGGQYNLTLTSYQDTGNYTCSVDNGVRDRGGQVVIATAIARVVLQDAPQLPRAANPEFQSGETGERLELYRTLYSVPELSNVTWFYNSAPLPASTRGSGSLGTAVSMQLPVHGSLVEVEGRRVTLPVTVSANSTGTYRLQACNPVQCSSAEFTLLPAGPPFPPRIVGATPSSGSIVLLVEPSYPGGDFFQWFHVQYRRQDSQEGQWSEVGSVGNRSSSDRTPVTVTVEGLEPDTSYVFRVRAQNSRPERNFSNYTVTTNATLPEGQAGPSTGALVGGVVGSIGGLAVLIVVLVILLRKRKEFSKSDKNSNQAALDVASADQEPQGNGKEAAVTAGIVHPIFADGPEQEMSQRPPVYAVVDKKAKKNATQKQAAGMMGAQRNKKRGKGKGRENAKVQDLNPAKGLHGANGGAAPSREADDSGCVYVTVEGTAPPSLNSPRPSTAPKPARTEQRLQDDAVIYTAIDHTKKAPPPMPDEDRKY